MTDKQPINTPSLAGWTMAAAAAVLGFAVCYLIVGLGFMGSALIAVLLLLVVGFILGMPRSTTPVAAEAPAAAPAAPVAAAPVAPVAAPTPAPAQEPAAPVAAPVVAAAAAESAPSRPQGLEAARGGQPDDLKRIKGVGPALEGLLNRLGYFHFDQIAAWSPAEIAWVDQNLEGFKGRVTRDGWAAQARILAAGGETEFSARKS